MSLDPQNPPRPVPTVEEVVPGLWAVLSPDGDLLSFPCSTKADADWELLAALMADAEKRGEP